MNSAYWDKYRLILNKYLIHTQLFVKNNCNFSM